MNATFLRTAGLLIVSNTFMTFAWYAHLRNLSDRKWYIAAILSWGIAFFEYMFMIPANRIGSTEYSLAQLKILQEVITLTVFVPFVVLYMRQPTAARFSLGRVVHTRSGLLHVSLARHHLSDRPSTSFAS